MNSKKALLTACAAAFSAIISAQTVPAQAAPARCETINGGVEYRAYLPDQKRYIYVSVKALQGYFPSVFVMVDKNYDTGKTKVAAGDPMVSWWLDRSRPMEFTTDQVIVRWASSGTWTAMTSWISSPDASEIKQPIRGLDRTASGFSGTGSSDTNTFAFQTRIELSNFDSEAFDVVLPGVSYDGVTLSPPPVHFTREDKIVSASC